MTRGNSTIRTLAVTLAACLLCFTLADAKKPDKPGGGNGGGGEILVVKLDTADGVGTHDHAYDVNDLREVVGRVKLQTGESSAAYWTVVETDGVVQSSLNLLDGGHSATAINNFGEIVGQTDDASGIPIGVYWPTPSSAAIVLPLLPGYDVSLPHAINNNGIICGLVAINGEDWQSTRAVVWRVTFSNGDPVISQPVELPAGGAGSAAQDVTDNDESGIAQVVGFQRATQTALLWEVQSLSDGTLSIPPNPQVLDLDVGAFATGANNSGLVCGRTERDAVVWSSGSALILDRPGKGKKRVPRAWAWDIGESGIIVGEAGDITNPRACFWDGIEGSLTYLDDYLETDSPLLGLDSAEAVNAFGDIVGVGWNGAFIAIPASP